MNVFQAPLKIVSSLLGARSIVKEPYINWSCLVYEQSFNKFELGCVWEFVALIVSTLNGKDLFWFRTARWRALLAGAIAGPSMLLTGLNTEHTSLAIYILMRAAVLASRCGIKSERFGRICKPLTWAHGDIFLMCLGSSQILWVSFSSKLHYFVKHDVALCCY